MAFIYNDVTDKWTKWDYILLKVYDMLEKYKCPQCGGYIWSCDSNIAKGLSKTITKIICRKTRETQDEYSKMSATKGSKGGNKDKTSGLNIAIEYNLHLEDKKAGKRMPSYADFLIEKLKLRKS